MKRALLLIALLVLPPLALAAPPEPQAWSPYSAAGHTLNAIALADAANVTVAAWAAPTPSTPTAANPTPSVPVTERYDVSAFATDRGILWNSSPPGNSIPPGKDHISISRDGRIAVAAQAAQPQSTQSAPNLVAYRTDAQLAAGPQNPLPGTPQPPPTMAPVWSVRLAGGIVALALSGDGSTTAVSEVNVQATGPQTTQSTRTIRVYGPTGAQRLALTATGNATSLAFPHDGARLAVGGDESGGTGFVQLLGVSASSTDKASVDSRVSALDLAADGRVLVAGTESGQAVTWRPRGGTLGQPERALDLGLGAVRDVAVARSGTTAIVGADRGIAVLRLDAEIVRVAYNVTTPDPVTSVDVSDDGSYFLVVARDAFGYGASGPQRLWNLTGPFQSGAMDGEARDLVLKRGDAVAAYRFGRSLQFLHRTEAGLVADIPAAVPGPDGSIAFDAVVVATGSANDRVRVRLPQAPGVEFSANVTEAALAPGRDLAVRIVVSPRGLEPGAYAFVASVESLQGGGVANLTLPVSILPRSGVGLALTGPAERTLARGAQDLAVFVLQNAGNTRVNATISFTQTVSAGANWPITLESDRASVPPGATTSVVLRVGHPPQSANGTVDRITVTAVTDAGTVSKVVTYTLSPDLGVRIDTPSRVRFVGPAQSTWFNLTVQNTGSVRTAFEVFYEKTSETGAGWNVEVDVNPFNLTAAGTATATRTIPLRVFAPSTGTATDRVALFVEVRSLEKIGRKAAVAENLTLIANLDPNLAPKPPGTVPCDGARCLPAPGLVVSVFAVGAVAAFVRGRRR